MILIEIFIIFHFAMKGRRINKIGLRSRLEFDLKRQTIET